MALQPDNASDREGALSPILKEGFQMLRSLTTLCACAMVAVLLLSSDASACGKRRARGGGTSYGGSATSYGGSGTSYGYPAGYGYPVGDGAGYGYPVGDGAGYGYPAGSGYNPGGIGGPRSGLGVRPGPGFGGLGPRR
jgi:hypothetical protein